MQKLALSAKFLKKIIGIGVINARAGWIVPWEPCELAQFIFSYNN